MNNSIKLLDLQTGKYLELFKDYAYCGNAILFHGFDDDCLPTFTNGFENMINQDWACCAEICYKTEPQEPLKTLCEKTGAVVYGGRYVLLENEKCGNIYCEKNKWGTVYYLNKNIYSFIPCLEFNPQNDKKQTVARFFSLDNCQDDLIGNIFEEYSKQFRNEPNKFEELMQLFITNYVKL